MAENYNYFYRYKRKSKFYDVRNKEENISNYVNYMLARTSQMFRYDNLPETLDKRMLELYLQINGYVAIMPYNGQLYCYNGTLGGLPNAYYMPTECIITNPYQNLSKSAKIGEECVVIPNDSLYMGLLPLFHRYAAAMAENDLSIYLADVNTRIQAIISAQDDTTRASAQKYLDDIEKGATGIIAEMPFLEGLKTSPFGNNANQHGITSLIELQQYLKASWYNEIGLNANYNMKRESLNSSESQLNNDSLLPLVDDMLSQREQGIDAVNALFGTNIKVTLNSSWEDNQIEIEQEHVEEPEQDEQTEEESTNEG